MTPRPKQPNPRAKTERGPDRRSKPQTPEEAQKAGKEFTERRKSQIAERRKAETKAELGESKSSKHIEDLANASKKRANWNRELKRLTAKKSSGKKLSFSEKKRFDDLTEKLAKKS